MKRKPKHRAKRKCASCEDWKQNYLSASRNHCELTSSLKIAATAFVEHMAMLDALCRQLEHADKLIIAQDYAIELWRVRALAAKDADAALAQYVLSYQTYRQRIIDADRTEAMMEYVPLAISTERGLNSAND